MRADTPAFQHRPLWKRGLHEARRRSTLFQQADKQIIRRGADLRNLEQGTQSLHSGDTIFIQSFQRKNQALRSVTKLQTRGDGGCRSQPDRHAVKREHRGIETVHVVASVDGKSNSHCRTIRCICTAADYARTTLRSPLRQNSSASSSSIRSSNSSWLRLAIPTVVPTASRPSRISS